MFKKDRGHLCWWRGRGALGEALLEGVHLLLEAGGQAIAELLGVSPHLLDLLLPVGRVDLEELLDGLRRDVEARRVQGALLRDVADRGLLGCSTSHQECCCEQTTTTTTTK